VFKRIDHIALVVPDIDEAMSLYEDAFQVEFYLRDYNEEQGFEVAAFAVGDGHIELLSPTGPHSVIGGFLEKCGPGIHHFALEVERIEDCMRQVRSRGLQLTTETPRRGSGDSRIAFIHPKSLLGTMVELVAFPEKVTERSSDMPHVGGAK
jgi:methylmalonyl-CoA/ethylmalonyl-CoA epimerase